MKHLMSGNEATARGVYEAGIKICSAYPGTPSTEITEAAVKYPEIYCEWAPNEKVATETACGASIGGARSFCAMKHVGLNVAADPFYTMSYIGVNGGMVLGVADDRVCIPLRTSRTAAAMPLAPRFPCWSRRIPRNARTLPSWPMPFPRSLTPRWCCG